MEDQQPAAVPNREGGPTELQRLTIQFGWDGTFPVLGIPPLDRLRVLDRDLKRLEAEGMLQPGKIGRSRPFPVVAHRPGALQRFLERRG